MILVEGSQIKTGLSGCRGPHVHRALERDGRVKFIPSLGIGPENIATRQLDL